MTQPNPPNKFQPDPSQATPTSRVFITLAVTLAIALGSAALCLSGVGVPATPSVVGGAIMLAVLWLVSLTLSRSLEGKINWLHPMVGLGALYVINFGGGAIYSYFDAYSSVRVPPLTPIVTTGVWAAVLGYSCLLLGFFVAALLRPGKLPAALRPNWLSAALEQRQTRLLLLFVCLALGWPNRIYQLLSGHYAFGLPSSTPSTADTSFTATFGMFEYFLPIAIVIVTINVLAGAQPGAAIYSFAVIVLADMCWGFVTGSKGQAFSPLAWSLATWYALSYQRLKWRSWLYLAGLVVVILILFPLFNAYRLTNSRATNPFLAWQTSLSQQLSSSYDLVGSSAHAVAARLDGIAPLAMVITYTPAAWNFQYGGTFASALFSPVPRFIWSGKPKPFDKINFGRFYYLQSKNDYGTSHTPTTPGELYLNFGWWGIIFGMFGYGVIVRLVWTWYTASARGLGELLILLLLWSSLLMTNGLFSDYIGGVPRSLAIALVVFWLALRLAARLGLARRPAGSLQVQGGA